MATSEEPAAPDARGDQGPAHLVSQLLQVERSLRRTQEEARQMAAALQQTREMLDSVQRLAHLLPPLQEEVRLLQARLLQMERRHDQAVTLASDTLRQRRSDLEQFHQASSSLAQRLQSLEVRVAALEEAVRSLESPVRRLDETLAQVQVGMQAADSHLQDGLLRLQQQVERLLALEGAVARASSELDALQGKHEALAARLHVLQPMLQEHSEQLQKLGSRLESEREERRQPRSDLDRLVQRVAALEGHVQRSGLEQEEQARHIELVSQRVQELAQSLLVLSQEVDHRQQRLQQLIAQFIQLLERQKRRYQDLIRQEVREIRSGLEGLER